MSLAPACYPSFALESHPAFIEYQDVLEDVEEYTNAEET